MENLSKVANMLQIVDHAIVVEEEVAASEVEEAVVEEAEISDVKRKVQKRKREVIARESTTLNLKRNLGGKEAVITVVGAEDVAVEEVEVVVVTVAVCVLAVKALETSRGRTRTTGMTTKATVLKEIAERRGREAEVTQADVQEDSEDAQDVHQHRVQVMKEVTTVIQTAAVINIMVMVREEEIVEVTIAVETVNVMVIGDHGGEDMDATEKLSKEVKTVTIVDKTKVFAKSPTK